MNPDPRPSASRKRSALSVLAAVTLSLTAAGATPQQPEAARLPPSAQRAYDAVAGRFDTLAAMEVVNFMSTSWRLAGNPGFNASIDRIRDLLVKAGYSTGALGVGR